MSQWKDFLKTPKKSSSQPTSKQLKKMKKTTAKSTDAQSVRGDSADVVATAAAAAFADAATFQEDGNFLDQPDPLADLNIDSPVEAPQETIRRLQAQLQQDQHLIQQLQGEVQQAQQAQNQYYLMAQQQPQGPGATQGFNQGQDTDVPMQEDVASSQRAAQPPPRDGPKGAKQKKDPIFNAGAQSRFIDKSFTEKRGIIINVLNNQVHGSSQFAGVLRIGLQDPFYFPRYWADHGNILKTHAWAMVNKHFEDCNFNLGFGDDGLSVSMDDYSATITVSPMSLSAQGREDQVANGDAEGPFWFLLCPPLLKPTLIRILPDGTEDRAIILNLRLHQVVPQFRKSCKPGSKRKQAHEDEPSRKQPPGYTPANRPSNRSKLTGPSPAKLARQVEQVESQVRNTNRQVQEFRRDVAGLHQSIKVYPANEREPIVWPPPNKLPPLPDF